MAAPAKRQQVFAPLNGSFPIDHFKECDEHYQKYMACLKENHNSATKCRVETRSYMECRMNNDLMQRESLADLGLSDISQSDTRKT